jgi:hypothetical protein
MHEWLMSGNAKHALALLDCYDAIYRPLLEDDRMSDYDQNDYIFGLLGDRTFDRTRALLPVPMDKACKHRRNPNKANCPKDKLPILYERCRASNRLLQ